MTSPSPADDILQNRLGPPPLSALQAIIAAYPGMAAFALVLETQDGALEVYSAGCTSIETIGMFYFGANAAANGSRGG